jgi:hypothetical protein
LEWKAMNKAFEDILRNIFPEVKAVKIVKHRKTSQKPADK